MDYVKYENILLKISSDRPESDIKSTEIILSNPSYELLNQYDSYYYKRGTPIKYRQFCIGYNVKTIPNLIGETEWYVPVPSNKLFVIKKAICKEFKEKYKKYLIKLKKKYMWRTILTLYQIKHQTTVVSCGQIYTSNNGIPFELCHKIWEFNKN